MPSGVCEPLTVGVSTGCTRARTHLRSVEGLAGDKDQSGEDLGQQSIDAAHQIDAGTATFEKGPFATEGLGAGVQHRCRLCGSVWKLEP
jgi:hypothetical protein